MSGKEIGKYLGYTDSDISDGEIRHFEGSIDGDVTAYSKVELDTGIFDHVKQPRIQP